MSPEPIDPADAANPPAPAAGSTASAQHTLRRRLAELRGEASRAFEQALDAPPAARAALHRHTLLCQELLLKLQEQVLLPALLDSRPDTAAAVALAGREADLIRDLSALLRGPPPPAPATAAQGGELLAVIDGLAALNAARVDELLREATSAPLRWPVLLQEVEALLSRWRDEWQRDGDIEDEDGDPVGPPQG